MIAYVLALIALAFAFAGGVVFAKPTENELAALEALAKNDAQKALALFHKDKAKASALVISEADASKAVLQDVKKL